MTKSLFIIVVPLLLFCQGSFAQVSFTIPPNAVPQNINKAEYFLDNEPGYGNGTDIPLSASTDLVLNNIAIDINGFSTGVHRVYFRSRDVAGVWSETNVKLFAVLDGSFIFPFNPAASNITRMEYFFDADPGFGNGTSISISPSTDVVLNNIAIDITGLSNGVHRVYFRSMDAEGKWSETNIKIFAFVLVSLPPSLVAVDITRMEYFIDADPGYGNGTAIPITNSADVSLNDILINITGLAKGVHRVYFRSMDADGKWSETNIRLFAVLDPNFNFPSNLTPGNITKLEYFIDTDPGFGNGNTVTVTPSNDISKTFDADISGLPDGKHHIYIRTFDSWSLTNVREFNIGSPVPVTWISFSGAWKNGVVVLNWKTAAEENNKSYEVERSDDGIHFKKIGSVAGGGSSNEQHNYFFTDNLQVNGVAPLLYYRIKQNDVDGGSSYSAIISLKNPVSVSIQVYPNPSFGLFKLFLNKKPSGQVRLNIYDNKGGLVLQKNISEVVTEFNLTGKSKGVYFLKVSGTEGGEKTVPLELR